MGLGHQRGWNQASEFLYAGMCEYVGSVVSGFMTGAARIKTHFIGF